MYAIVDIETTGTSGVEDGITEVAVVLHDGKKVRDEYSTLLDPGRSIPPNVSFLTGITDEMVKGAPAFGDIAEELHQRLQGRVFVAHNVHFDLSFLRKAFAQHGYEFRPKKLCTVRAARKVLPSLSSYGLDPICRKLGINNKGRHRAWGDARATAQLLEHLLKEDHRGTIPTLIHQPGKEASLPPNLPRERFDRLPQRAGVYYFHDRWGRIIYVGKAKRIQERVLQHFQGEQPQKLRLKQTVRDISHRETGNELVAELMESSAIRKHMPTFNKAQKFRGKVHSLIRYTDRCGYPRFGVLPKQNEQDMLMGFDRMTDAKNFLWRAVERWGLCPKLCNLQTLNGNCTHSEQGICNGACTGKEDPVDYAERFEGAVAEILRDRDKSFVLVGEGRENGECSLVFVENGSYLGYTYLDEKNDLNDLERIKSFMTRQQDDPDTRRIIRKYLQQPKGLQVMELS